MHFGTPDLMVHPMSSHPSSDRGGDFHVTSLERPALVRVDACQYRDQIIALFERAGNMQLRRRFDWYYATHAQPQPACWILQRRNGDVCGLCSVSFRSLRCGDRLLRAGVAGNLLTDRRNDTAFGTFSLIRATKSLVTKGELDLLLGIPNARSEPLFTAAGFSVLGRWQTRAMIFDSRTLLSSRLGASGLLVSAFVDLLAKTRRSVPALPRKHPRPLHFEIARMTDLEEFDTSRWSHPNDEIVTQLTARYVRERFLSDPLANYEVVRGQTTDGDTCAYVILRHTTGRVSLADYALDRAKTSLEHLLLSLFSWSSIRRAGLWVTHLPSRTLTKSLSSLLPIPHRFSGYPDLPLIGFWLPTHPLASRFASQDSWNLLTGCNDV